MATLNLDGSDLHYEQHGKGPTVVFVHGGVMNGAITWSAALVAKSTRSTEELVPTPGRSRAGRKNRAGEGDLA